MGANGRLWATLLELGNPFVMIYEHDLVTLLCLYSILCVLLQISRSIPLVRSYVIYNIARHTYKPFVRLRYRIVFHEIEHSASNSLKWRSSIIPYIAMRMHLRSSCCSLFCRFCRYVPVYYVLCAEDMLKTTPCDRLYCHHHTMSRQKSEA